jgi:phospholipase/carboxylesterase
MTDIKTLKRDRSSEILTSFVHKYVPANEASGNKRAITLLLLHGTGGNENDLLPLGRELAPNAALLSPRGKILEGEMPRFFRRLAEGVFDIEDLKFRSNELADFVRSASGEYGFDPERVVAVGYSNGANIAASILLLRPETFLGAVLFRAMLPLVPEKLPNLSGKSVFLTAGNFDQIIPKRQVEKLNQILSESKAEVTLNWTPSDHSLTQDELRKARDFLQTHYS